jgi:hypothetical protein
MGKFFVHDVGVHADRDFLGAGVITSSFQGVSMARHALFAKSNGVL